MGTGNNASTVVRFNDFEDPWGVHLGAIHQQFGSATYSYDVTAPKNYWAGGAAAVIFDSNDDLNQGTVDYSPEPMSSSPTAGPTVTPGIPRPLPAARS